MVYSSKRMTTKEYRKSLSEPKSSSTLNPPVRLLNFRPHQLFSFNHNYFDVPLSLNFDGSQHVLIDNL